jgi:CheY-like chemotaxis protein
VADAPTDGLRGKEILVVEDDYLIAQQTADALVAAGAGIVGPVATVQAAMTMLDRIPELAAAVLDINLRNERVYPVADRLIERGIPIVFATGYEELLLDRKYVGLPRCPKPIDQAALVAVLRRLTG